MQGVPNFRFHHLGVVVPDLEKALVFFEKGLGHVLLDGPYDDPIQQARVAFIGEARQVFEVVAPSNAGSHVERLVQRGTGAYHVCFEVDELEAAIAHVRSEGALIIANPTPAVAFDGRRIAWFYTPTRALVELVEAQRCP